MHLLRKIGPHLTELDMEKEEEDHKVYEEEKLIEDSRSFVGYEVGYSLENLGVVIRPDGRMEKGGLGFYWDAFSLQTWPL